MRAPAASLIRELAEAAAPGAIDLALIRPAHAPPAAALAALRATSPPDLDYAPTLGLPELRRALARRRPTHGTDGASVIVTVGAQQALALAVLGLVEPGDDVLLPDVAYPSYEALCSMVGARVRRAPLRALAAALTDSTRLVLLSSPSNPSGEALTAGEWRDLLARAERVGAWVVSDEAYADLGLRDASIAVPSGPTCLHVGSASKSFAIPGARLGWLVGPPALVERLRPLQQHLVTCAPRAAQRAVLAALTDEIDEAGEATLAAARALYRERLATCARAVAELPGVGLSPPAGGLCVWLDVRETVGADTRRFALDLARAGEVAVVPGEAFGMAGAGFLRVSFAVTPAALAEGLRRLGRALVAEVGA